MLVIVIKGLPEESRLDGRSTPRRLQIPPLRSCGAPVGMTRVGRLRSGRIATRMDRIRNRCSAKTAKRPPGHVALQKKSAKKPPAYVQACRFFLDHGGLVTKSRQGRILPYAWNPLLTVTNGTFIDQGAKGTGSLAQGKSHSEWSVVIGSRRMARSAGI
jgi:hypothetical protein